jgi:ATP-dependent Lon protease
MSKRKFSHINQDIDDLDGNLKKKIRKLEKDNNELKDRNKKLEDKMVSINNNYTKINEELVDLKERLEEIEYDKDPDYVPESEESSDFSSDDEDEGDNLFKKMLKKILENPDEYIKSRLEESGITKNIPKHIKLVNEYLELIKNENLNDSEFKYFFKLNLSQKQKIINSEKKLSNTNDTVPLRYKLLNSNLPDKIQKLILQKVNIINKMDNHSSEYHKLNQWISGLLQIKWNTIVKFPVNKKDKTDKIIKFLNKSKNLLDKTIYGQYDTKEHILQIIGKLIINPESIGNVFAIHGPMGTGKTTIIKDGLSKVLGLPFNFISLGGTSDSSFLDGHSYTYEGSIPGRIVECLKISGCMNPVFYFDELDKVSDTTKGQEIINLLIHLTDSTQNTNFQDKYYTGIPFDLSKAIFVFSFNEIEKVNPILRDRMNLIKVQSFNNNDKFEISKNYLLPKILEDYNIKLTKDVIFDDEVLKTIIAKYNNNEAGVRNIKKNLETIFSKLNLIKITKNEKNETSKIDLLKNVDFTDYKFPIKLNMELIDKLIKNNNKPNIPDFMYS